MAGKPKPATPLQAALQPVGAALDRWAWRKLQDSNPELAAMMETAIARGARPIDLRRYVIERTGKQDLAEFVEQAARWLAENGELS